MINYILETFFDKKKVESKKNKILTFIGENRQAVSFQDRRKPSITLNATALSEYFDKVAGLNTKERLDYTNLF
ncbi:MAG: hypothetical protein E7348_05860 [Clostridiales bacterium]|nr:hypothetical protein [Clostridiales bacterium]